MSPITPRLTSTPDSRWLIWMGLAIWMSLVAVTALWQPVIGAGVFAISLAARVVWAPRARAEARADIGRSGVIRALDRALDQAPGSVLLALSVQMDDNPGVADRFDAADQSRLHDIISDRLTDALGAGEKIGAFNTCAFALTVDPREAVTMESTIHLSRRIQQALGKPIDIAGERLFMSFSIGFCLSDRVTHRTGAQMVSASHVALLEARRHGPAAIRSYSTKMQERIDERAQLDRELTDALENGQIQAYFQPQVSAQTGEITGFETLARWVHPERGIVPPFEFLPVLEKSGRMPDLGRVMLRDALSALQHWRNRGMTVPRVGVNFATAELRDPSFVERVEMELDRFGLTADCLAIEVLETVVADKSDTIIIDNLSGLARLGCCIDLDDFGTGHASITNIRRFSIERIKIDRSFVSGVDQDPEQQEMVATIIDMAQRLGLDTLAEGVENEEERDVIAQMGCGHLQGFGIARPMAMGETDQWITTYNANRLGLTPLRRQGGRA